MGLYHSVYRAYGFAIPAVDIDTLDTALADQPDAERLGRIHHQYLGDFEKTFLLAESTEVEACDFARLTPGDFARYEIPVWNRVLHDMAVRLGHAEHPEPAWLLIHDYS